ncbi:kinesin, partial [Trypanosoma theileri]
RVEEICAALLETEQELHSMQQERLAACIGAEKHERQVLLTSEDDTWKVLSASLLNSYSLIEQSTFVEEEILTATDSVLFDGDALTDVNSLRKQLLLPAANSVVALSLLEQYKQYCFEEFVSYLTAVHGVRLVSAVDNNTSALRDEYEVTLTALEEHHYQELLSLQKENTELRTNVTYLRQDLELMTNLDQLEKEEGKEKEKDMGVSRQHTRHPHTDSRRSSWSSVNDESSTSRQTRTGTTLGGYISSFFQRQSSQSDRVDVSTPPPRTASPRSMAASPTRPPLAPGSLSRANQLIPPTKKRSQRKDDSSSAENIQMSSFYD